VVREFAQPRRNPGQDDLYLDRGLHISLMQLMKKRNDTIELVQSDRATIRCISYSKSNNDILAIGRADGLLRLWCPSEPHPRIEARHRYQIRSLAWRPQVDEWTTEREQLLVGENSGIVYCYAIDWVYGSTDMRIVWKVQPHLQQVCGLEWSTDGLQWVSGSNDNSVALFDTIDPSRPRHVWRHGAAVKAMAFCPWQPRLLATGGGSLDRTIRFWHTFSGQKVAELPVRSQVTSLIWSRTCKEILATFGFANPPHPIRMAIFSWPGLDQIMKVAWSMEHRSLHAVQHPHGGQVVVAGSNEILHFYNIWEEGDSQIPPARGSFHSDIIELVEGIDIRDMGIR